MPQNSNSSRQTRNSQNDLDAAQAKMSAQVTEFTQHEGFLNLVKQAVKEAVREEFKILQQEITKLSKQVDVNESKIMTLLIENDSKSKLISNMEKQISHQADQISSLQRSSVDAEQYSRRNCLRVFGIPESANENTDTAILELAKEKLGIQLNLCDLDRSHRVGSASATQIAKHNTSSGTGSSSCDTASASTSNANAKVSSDSSWANKVSTAGKATHHRPRPIIVKFATYRARQSVLSVRRKLKNSGIAISEDLTTANYAILKAAKESKNVSASWSRDGRIYVALTAGDGKTTKKLVRSVEEARRL